MGSTVKVAAAAVAMIAAMMMQMVPARSQGQAGPDRDVEAVREILRSRYLYDVPLTVLQRSTVDSILMGTDSYTHVFESKDNDYRSLFDEKSYDLGMEFGRDRQGIFVDRVDYGSPSYDAGVCLGDRVLSIDGTSTTGMTWTEAMRAVVAAERAGIMLAAERGGATIKIKIPVKATYPDGLTIYLEPPTAYVQVTTITSNTGFSLAFSAALWKRKGISRVVLDLRNCGGGSVHGAEETLKLFAKEQDLLYMTQDRSGTYEYVRASSQGYCHGFDVVVVVNGNTASAAEMIASGLKDLGYATVVGDTTYGKGTSLVVYDLPSGKSIAVSYQHLYSPKGRSIERNMGYHGVVPHVVSQVLATEHDISLDTLRMVSVALPNLKTLRATYDSVSTTTVQKIQQKLPASVRGVDPMYVAVAIWSEQGRAWALSRSASLALASTSGAPSVNGQRR